MDLNNKPIIGNRKLCIEITSEDKVLKSKDSMQKSTLQKSNIIPDDSKTFKINIFKNYTIGINKPLILLKITLFLYYGAGSFMNSFLTVLYKQRGVSLTDLSTMLIVTPAFQFIATTLSGVAADKTGRAKPVFVFNLLILMVVLFGITILPKINSTNREMLSLNFTCHGNEFKAITSCEEINEPIELEFCRGLCKDVLKERCSARNICEKFDYYKELNTPFIVYINDTFLKMNNDSCQYNATLPLKGNSSSWCSNNENKHCELSCSWYSKTDIVESSWTLVAYFVLYVLFQATFSNGYRCLDITTMLLAKEHNSNIGHERFFAILSYIVISPLAGYISKITTPLGGVNNYSSGLYLSIIMYAFLLPFLYKLQVRVKPPGKKMWKKSLILLKNPDVLTYFMVVLVLGTAWNFGKSILFWYLDGLNASSLLVSLTASISALYCLPFLLVSHWWIKRVGSNTVFILALLAYSINSTGYSFIQNPWFSLLLESTDVLSYHILWVATVEYSHDISPEGLTATVIAVSGALHFSVGKVVSGLIAKFVMSNFGGKAAFRCNAIMTLTAAILYAFYLFVSNKGEKAKNKLNPKEEQNFIVKGIATTKMEE